MKQTYFSLLLAAILLSGCTEDRDIQPQSITINPESVLVHYWNFNSLSGQVSSISPDFSLVPDGAEITYPGTGDGYMDDFNPGYAQNARNGDGSGSGFRARNPSDTRYVLLSLPSTGYKDLVVSFASARSGSGATEQHYSYTVDGTNFIDTGLSAATFTPLQDPTSSQVTLDLSGIPAVNDNPNFKIKIAFGGDTASGTSGNNRFDNITMDGVPLTPGSGNIDNSVYLLHYWNFNALASGTLTSIAPDSSLVAATAAITYEGTGAGYMDSFSPGSDVNAQNGDAAGTGLRTRNPSDNRALIISAPTTGYKSVIVKFATARSSASGASIQNYTYSTDGVNFINTGLSTTTYSPDIDPAYTIVTLDFSAIPGASNNPNFKIRIGFTGAEAAGSSGNNRFDNITFEGKQL